MNPEHKLCYDAARCGEVAEWSNVPDSKSGVPQGTVGSNPTLSASEHPETRMPTGFAGFLFFSARVSTPAVDLCILIVAAFFALPIDAQCISMRTFFLRCRRQHRLDKSSCARYCVQSFPNVSAAIRMMDHNPFAGRLAATARNGACDTSVAVICFTQRWPQNFQPKSSRVLYSHATRFYEAGLFLHFYCCCQNIVQG